MDITKELLDQNISTMRGRFDEAVASANKIAGAIAILEDLRKFSDVEPPDPTVISDENAAIQNNVETKIREAEGKDAIPLQDFAEALAGAGAEVGEVEAVCNATEEECS